MLEAAKALLMLYLKFDRLRREAVFPVNSEEEEEETTQTSWTHENGCNPHCIFLFLLQNLAFDSTVLLDFLISTETCFLEYFVRYLKLLREDWHHFVQICTCFDLASEGGASVFVGPSKEKNSCLSVLHLQNVPNFPEPHTSLSLTSSLCKSVNQQGDNQAVKPNKSNSLIRTDKTSSLSCLQRLVDYDSSDSELESVGEECLADMKQTSVNNQGSYKIREAVCMDVDDKLKTQKPKLLPLGQKCLNMSSLFDCKMSPVSPASVEGMLIASMKCLEELQKAISRLQRRNLFPYNPRALLKLLTHIETLSKSTNPL
uniref:Lines homolog 1 n=1 Tax=Sphenodon punctatus TaxID=8508 RepID=A0A8D0GVA3_SPHPU